MDPTLVVSVIVAVLTGGFGTEAFRTFRDRKRSDFELFYPTWKEEMERLHREIRELQVMVLSLSTEVQRLGGDPLAVRHEALLGLQDHPSSDSEKE